MCQIWIRLTTSTPLNTFLKPGSEVWYGNSKTPCASFLVSVSQCPWTRPQVRYMATNCAKVWTFKASQVINLTLTKIRAHDFRYVAVIVLSTGAQGKAFKTSHKHFCTNCHTGLHTGGGPNLGRDQFSLISHVSKLETPQPSTLLLAKELKKTRPVHSPCSCWKKT